MVFLGMLISPFKKSGKTGSKFAFVRYDCSIFANMAIFSANGMAVEGEKLVVKLETFKQNDKREFSQQCMHKPQ